jgi:hypothetical protein
MGQYEHAVKTILTELRAHRDIWLLFSQLEELTQLPSDELAFVLNAMVRMKVIIVEVAEGELDYDQPFHDSALIREELPKFMLEGPPVFSHFMKLMVIRLAPHVS